MAFYSVKETIGSRILILIIVICCVHSQIIFDIQEEQVPPVLIGNVRRAANIPNRPNLEFSIINRVNYQRDLFTLDPRSGDLTSKVTLDREELCGTVPRCNLVTIIAASSPPDFLTRFTVNVSVVDANDQSPKFREKNFTISMSERSQINATFPLPAAYDPDVESLFKVKGYRLEPLFQMRFDLLQDTPESGYGEPTVQLRLRGRLDRENQATHDITLVAYDGGVPPHEAKLPIRINVLDENDNSPVFTFPSYTKTVKEIQVVGPSILTVNATDIDQGDNGRVGYEFSLDVDRKTREFFRIVESSGNIHLIQSLIKEGGSSFVFKVKAFDYGSPPKSSEAEVIISIQDTVNDPPSIRVSPWKPLGDSALVSESSIIGTKVAFVDVEDTDSDNNGATNCEADSEYFILQPYTKAGVYTISVARKLNREVDQTHTLLIRCSDLGDPPQTSTANLSIIVQDANDNAPEFGRKVYKMKVKENQDSGKQVGIVHATDLDQNENGQVRYALEAGVSQFTIDERHGIVTTAVQNLDREKTAFYSFRVFAIDGGAEPLTGTASVIVHIEDLNDVWPRFDNASYRFFVSESTPLNAVIGSVHANDLDLNLGGIVEYIMVHSPLYSDPPFSLSRQDGSIRLSEPLNYEKVSNYDFIVTAVDLGRPPRNSSVDVNILILDENDNAPVITFPSPDNLSVTLNLDVSPGHEVVRVIADDADSGENGRLSYSLTYGNSSSKLFWINEDTGLITLISPLKESDVRRYDIVISVHDNGVKQKATQAILQVDVVRSVKRTGSSSDSNMTIVIIMVCVTLFVAVVVLATLCFIRHLDKKRYEADKRASKNGSTTKGNYTSAGQGCDLYFDTTVEVTPSFQKQSVTSSTRRSTTNHKPGKKSVTFDEETHASISSDATNPLNDSIFMETGQGMTTFKPNPPPLLYTQSGTLVPTTSVDLNIDVSSKQNLNSSRNSIPSHSNQPSPRLMFGENRPDTVINNALQQHNALVRSVRGNHHRPRHSSRQDAPAANRDTDLSSSSSVETSDSGHGSELDVSAVKINV